MTKHSTSPWTTDKTTSGEDTHIVDNEGGTVLYPAFFCQLDGTLVAYLCWLENGRANRRLVLAAPQLYEACKEALVQIAAEFPGQNWGDVKMVLAKAIAAAEGGDDE
jgi:hypothetical protein